MCTLFALSFRVRRGWIGTKPPARENGVIIVYPGSLLSLNILATMTELHEQTPWRVLSNARFPFPDRLLMNPTQISVSPLAHSTSP